MECSLSSSNYSTHVCSCPASWLGPPPTCRRLASEHICPALSLSLTVSSAVCTTLSLSCLTHGSALTRPHAKRLLSTVAHSNLCQKSRSSHLTASSRVRALHPKALAMTCRGQCGHQQCLAPPLHPQVAPACPSRSCPRTGLVTRSPCGTSQKDGQLRPP